MNIHDFRATVDSLVREAPADALPAAIGEFARGKATLEAKMLACDIQQATNGSDPKPQADLSTADIARMFTKSPQTVRDWIGKGLLDAYRFRGHEWRVTPESLQKFIGEQREPLKLEVSGPEPNLGAWRKAAGK
ncbi:MAG: helix-turn-helix domain-containing protein [Gemmatimonadota bacterium]